MNKNTSAHRQESGAVLIVALILLVVMTLLSLSGVRTVALGERMTANSYDRGLAFQAAEAALQVGESVASTQSKTGPMNAGFTSYGLYTDADGSCGNSPCANGLCSQPDKDCPARWLNTSFTGWQDASGLSLTSLSTTPQYIVEFLGGTYACNIQNPDTGAQNCKRYRITARSHNPTSSPGRAMVMLQSIYATE